MIAFIPENLDLQKVLSLFPPDEIKKFKIENLLYIISLVTGLPASYEHYDDPTGYVCLSSVILQGNIHNYKSYLIYLIKAGIIETDNQYIVGEKSKGYRFTVKYRTKTKTIKINNLKISSKKKISQRAKNECPELTKWYDSLLTIDADQAEKFIGNNIEMFINDSSDNPFLKYNISIININKIYFQNFSVTIDNTANRFHSNLTNLKSELRNYIIYNDEKLVSIDLTNSQPYLSAVLLKPQFYDYNEMPFNLTMISKQGNVELRLPTHLPPPMLVKNRNVIENQDVTQFTKLVSNGCLYEYFESQLRRSFGVQIVERSALKEIIFRVMYTSNRYNDQLKQLFKGLFPTVYAVFKYIKKKEKNSLAILLQRIESFLIIDVICKRIAREKPDLPIFTIHDSIVTTIGNEDYIEQVMAEELTKHIGITPTLKKENWTY